MKNKLHILLITAFICGATLSGCAINSMSSEEIQEYINEQMTAKTDEMKTQLDQSMQMSMEGYASRFLTDDEAKNLLTEEVKAEMKTSIEADLKNEIQGLNSLTEGQKEEVTALIAEALGNEPTTSNGTADVTVDGKDGSSSTKTTTTTTTEKQDKDKTDSSSKKSDDTDEKTTAADSGKLTDAQKKEIDNLVTKKMAAVVKDVGIVVEDSEGSKSAMTTSEKETLLNNIQTLFNAHNDIVKDLESLNKKVGENTGRIDTLCNQVGDIGRNNNNNNNNNNSGISDKQISAIKAEVERDVIAYIIKYLVDY